MSARIHKPPYTYKKTWWDRYSPFKWLAYWAAGFLVYTVEAMTLKRVRGMKMSGGYDLNWWWLSWRDKGPNTHGKWHRVGFLPPSFQ